MFACASLIIVSVSGLHQKLGLVPSSIAVLLLYSGMMKSLGSGKSIHQSFSPTPHLPGLPITSSTSPCRGP